MAKRKADILIHIDSNVISVWIDNAEDEVKRLQSVEGLFYSNFPSNVIGSHISVAFDPRWDPKDLAQDIKELFEDGTNNIVISNSP